MTPPNVLDSRPQFPENESITLKGDDMLIRIQYHGGKFDYIHHSRLHEFIETRELTQFYRPSEKTWVAIGIDPVRRQSRLYSPYSGPERRSREG